MNGNDWSPTNDRSTYRMMSEHGEAVRSATADGMVVLSRLGNGASRVISLAPSIKFVLQGEECYTIAGRARRLKAGNFMLVEAGTEALVRVASGSETIGLCIYLPTTSEPVLDLADIVRPVITGTSVDPLAMLLRNYAEKLAQDRRVSGPVTNELLRDAALGSQAFLSRFELKSSALTQVRASARTEVLQRLERALALIHANVRRPLCLEEISREAALSRFHLTRMFSKVYGSPPLSYHRKLRLKDAARELRCGIASPTQIAEDLGYASLSAFSRAFRSEFGVPPSRLAA